MNTIHASCPAFFEITLDRDKNVFLMMRFRGGPQYEEIHQALRIAMARYGLTVVRADDKDYTGDLWENVCVYMLGSRFGVAVFEEIDLRGSILMLPSSWASWSRITSGVSF